MFDFKKMVNHFDLSCLCMSLISRREKKSEVKLLNSDFDHSISGFLYYFILCVCVSVLF